ncbi:MAG: TonB-dependent receptor [Gammaproteobacteria bacterium]
MLTWSCPGAILSFTESANDEGRYIGGALPFVASLGLNYTPIQNWDLNLRVRHFGERALDSFNAEKSSPLTVVNFNSHYTIDDVTLGFSILNLFDSNDHDIDYVYNSRLPTEPSSGISDTHFHPIEPLTVRLSVVYQF